jgi:hypothetical protein
MLKEPLLKKLFLTFIKTFETDESVGLAET